LPLEAYDNKELDPKAPQDWIIIKKNHPPPREDNDGDISANSINDPSKLKQRTIHKTEISAHGLWKDRDGLCFWRRLKIQRYLLQSERYEGYWENTKEKCRMHRIFILFDDEDPREFAKRFKVAYETRAMADSLLKYNFYIENMPTH
jgi:hypothetical protein